MPIITTFIYCEDVSKDEKMHINNPMNIFTPAFVPGMFTFSIALSVLEVDISKKLTIRIKFINKHTGKTLIDSKEMPIDDKNFKPEPNLPGKMQGFWMDLRFQNVILENEGEYTTEVYFNNQKFNEYPVQVKSIN